MSDTRAHDRDPWRVLEAGACHENLRIRVYESSIVDVLGNVFSVCVGPPLPLLHVVPSKTEDVEPPQPVKQSARVIELALDHDAERVTLVGIGKLGRGDYRLISGLRELQLEDKPRSERRFFPSRVIAEQIGQDASSVSRRVNLCRNALAVLSAELFSRPDNDHRVIESGHAGYRFAPEVRFVDQEADLDHLHARGAGTPRGG